MTDHVCRLAIMVSVFTDLSTHCLDLEQWNVLATNILHCLDHGTEMGRLVDPEERTVFVFRPKQQTLVFDRPNQSIPVPSFATDLTLTVDDVFSWLLA